MENNELQKIWRNFDLEPKPVEELDLLLSSKVRSIMGKFLIIRVISIFVSGGLLIFLAIATFNRLTDVLYVINNVVLGLISLTALLLGFLSLKSLLNYQYDSSLKVWLESRIRLFSRQLYGKLRLLYLFMVPVLFILIELSIHVYYENKTMREVLRNEESVMGLIFGVIVGLAVSFYGAIRIRKFQSENLEFLKDLYKRLCLES
jgi:hypothetical protein